MKAKYIMSVLMPVFFSPALFAGQNMPSKTISNILVNLNSGIHFQIAEAMTNPDGCGGAVSIAAWYKLENNAQYEKEALSLLLSYQAQNKPITFQLEGCAGSYPKVIYIQ